MSQDYNRTSEGRDYRPLADQRHSQARAVLSPPPLQLKCAACDNPRFASIQKQEMPEEEELQLKKAIQRQPMEEEEELQMKKTMQRQPLEEEELQMKVAPFQLKRTAPIQRAAGAGSGLPDDTRSQMEGAFGQDFSRVNIHTNSESATDVGALAYTQGSDIHFAPGQYNPGSSSGQELLGHELTHVVQQREGRVQPTGEVGGMPLNDDASLEREADQKARSALQKKK